MPILSKIGVASLGAFGWSSGNPAYLSSYLLVGGGAGAINGVGAGGGAGDVLNSTATLSPGTTYSITIGNGGAVGSNGGNTTLSGTGLSTITSNCGLLGNASSYYGGTSGA